MRDISLKETSMPIGLKMLMILQVFELHLYLEVWRSRGRGAGFKTLSALPRRNFESSGGGNV
jgi:hypothetical protein